MNPRAPVEIAIPRLELRRENHRAAIYRVDTDRTVITPPCEVAGLRSASCQDRRLVAKRSRRIRWSAIRLTNTRRDGRARDVVTNSDATGLVHRSTSHPAKCCGRRESALLINNRIRRGQRLPRGIAQLIPANSDTGAGGD